MPQDLSPAHLTDAAEPFLKLVVTMPDGGRLEPEAAEGFRIMELIRAHGVPIKAECGGAGVCATCHVRIPQAWRHLLPPPSEEELAKLDEIPDADEGSRLACQILMTNDLDGLELSLQPDSVALQTFWVAG